ncbi:hypothetical protein C8R47DRAFT_1234529 [Mycena vitilis]|nr:hypothetical protein C8R47DRAFT_1234529 [Mycena vitilis]
MIPSSHSRAVEYSAVDWYSNLGCSYECDHVHRKVHAVLYFDYSPSFLFAFKRGRPLQLQSDENTLLDAHSCRKTVNGPKTCFACSTRLERISKRLEDTPSFSSFGDKGQKHGKTNYNEGIFVGYRSYENRALKPLFPFGPDLQLSPVSSEGVFSVTSKIKNSSKITGREVAQAYILDPQSSLPRPVKELKGFVKVALAGEEIKTVKIDLNREALEFYDDR